MKHEKSRPSQRRSQPAKPGFKVVELVREREIMENVPAA